MSQLRYAKMMLATNREIFSIATKEQQRTLAVGTMGTTAAFTIIKIPMGLPQTTGISCRGMIIISRSTTNNRHFMPRYDYYQLVPLHKQQELHAEV
jgi:hypothetical protein